MRILFLKDHLAWPRSSGHDLHAFHMMQALGQQGHAIGLATRAPVSSEALRGLDLVSCETFGPGEDTIPPTGATSWLLERFRSYWGIEEGTIRQVAQLAGRFGADAVVAVNLDALPYLAELTGPLRIWYAADESLWQHWSQVRIGRPGAWTNIKQGLINGLYERVHRNLLDRVWVVSQGDARAMRWVAGARRVDVVPNGVDAEHFRPQPGPTLPASCVFWGRLDTGPNAQALDWFCRRVWPKLAAEVPEAQFTIHGFKPTPAVRAWAGDGISVVPDLPDLRPSISRHQVVVMPFVSGGGIKNKLLEAASLGKAIVGTPRACSGLHSDGGLPLVCGRGVREWVLAIRELWSNAERRNQLGEAARRWVQAHHTWEAAARTAAAGLAQSLLARETRDDLCSASLLSREARS